MQIIMANIDHFRSRNEEREGKVIGSMQLKKRITLASSGFLSRSWFKISTHSANLPDWKCKAASLARATVSEKTTSSVSVVKEPSRLEEGAAADDDKSQPSMLRSSNRNIIVYRGLGEGSKKALD